MPTTIAQLLQKNADFAGPGHEALPTIAERRERGEEPAHILVVSCFDSRAFPEQFFQTGFATRDITTLRTIGGHPQKNLSDIVALDVLVRLDEIMVIHHTDCGTLKFTEEGMRQKVKERMGDSSRDLEIDAITFGAQSNLQESAKEDVEFLRSSPMLRKETKITGWLYNIKTGLVEQVQ